MRALLLDNAWREATRHRHRVSYKHVSSDASTLDQLKRRLPSLMSRLQSVQCLHGNLRTAQMAGIILSPEQRLVLDEIAALADEIVQCRKILSHEGAPKDPGIPSD